jgi:hypothetical protein
MHLTRKLCQSPEQSKQPQKQVEIKNKNFSCNAFSDWGFIKHGVP